MKIDKRYWDANCFLAWLKKEPGAESCKGVIRKAELGEIMIITSAITVTEVIKLDRTRPIPRRDAKMITDFFDQNYIRVRNVDLEMAKFAQNLMWDYEFLQHKDAIHVATAIQLGVPIFDTFDADLIKLNGKFGDPPLLIGHPDIPFQEELSLTEIS
jgi:predicted nucleic acid-binding protein